MELFQIVAITFILENIELFLHYRKGKGGEITLYRIYSSSPFLFFLSNISYIWLIFLSIRYSNLSLPLVFVIISKIFNIFTKIKLIKKISEAKIKDLDKRIKILWWLSYLDVLIYTYLVYKAFEI
jgi:hypothetical protein